MMVSRLNEWWTGLMKTEMDFKGQEQAEFIFKIILISFGVVGWLAGFFQQDFRLTIFVVLVGLAVSLLVCVPSWPIFRRHPLYFLSSEEIESRH
ncbi:signal peptidase complex subunit 1 [Pelomyxa schiedti]|nr:signal peptidase complex subunit 1 [Pelomyxa schiedti]